MIKRAAAEPGSLAEFGNADCVVSLLGEQDGGLFPDTFVFFCRFQVPALSLPLPPPDRKTVFPTGPADGVSKTVPALRGKAPHVWTDLYSITRMDLLELQIGSL